MNERRELELAEQILTLIMEWEDIASPLRKRQLDDIGHRLYGIAQRLDDRVEAQAVEQWHRWCSAVVGG